MREWFNKAKIPSSEHCSRLDQSIAETASACLSALTTHLQQDSHDVKGLHCSIVRLLSSHTKMLSGLGKNIQETTNQHRTYSHPVSADILLAFDQTYTHVFSL